MPISQQYSNRNIAQFVPGNCLYNDAETLTGTYALDSTFQASLQWSLGTFVPLNNANVPFILSFPQLGNTHSAFISTGAVLDPLAIESVLSNAFSGLVRFEYNSTTGNMLMTAMDYGTLNAFSFTINNNALNSTVPVNPLAIVPGRVLVYANDTAGAFSNNAYNYAPRVKYPSVSDTNVNNLAGLMISGMGDLIDVALFNQNTNNSFRLLPGNNVECIQKSQGIVVQPIGVLSSTFSSLFVETNPLPNLVGRFTQTPTGTTIQVPQGRVSIIQPSVVNDGLCVIKLN